MLHGAVVGFESVIMLIRRLILRVLEIVADILPVSVSVRGSAGNAKFALHRDTGGFILGVEVHVVGVVVGDRRQGAIGVGLSLIHI